MGGLTDSVLMGFGTSWRVRSGVTTPLNDPLREMMPVSSCPLSDTTASEPLERVGVMTRCECSAASDPAIPPPREETLARRDVIPRQESPRLLDVRRRRRRRGDSRGDGWLSGGDGDEGAGSAGGAGWVRALRFFLLLKDGMVGDGKGKMGIGTG